MTAELEKALAAADAAGNTEDAKYFANELRSLSGQQSASGKLVQDQFTLESADTGRGHVPAQASQQSFEVQPDTARQQGAKAAMETGDIRLQIPGTDIDYQTDIPVPSAVIDQERGIFDIAQGVKQLSMQSDILSAQRIAESGKVWGPKGTTRPATDAEIKAARIDFDKLTEQATAYTEEKKGELALFEEGAVDRPISSFGNRMIGQTVVSPIPGVGVASTPFKTGVKRLALEPVIAGGMSGLEFAPETGDRQSNVLMGMAFGGLFSLPAAINSMRKSGVITPEQEMKWTDNFNNLDEGSIAGLGEDERAFIVEAVKTQNPDLYEFATNFSNKSDKWVRSQLTELSEEEFSALTQGQKDNLSLAAWMNTRITKGQLIQDAREMNRELTLAGGDKGGSVDSEALHQVVNVEQPAAAKRRMDDLIRGGTTEEYTSDFGKTLKESVKNVDSMWKLMEGRAWDDAALNAPTDKRFNLDHATSVIDEWKENINTKQGAQALEGTVNKMIGYIERTYDIPALADIKADGNAIGGAMGQIHKLLEYTKATDGLSAIDSNALIKMVNQKIGTTRNAEELKQLKSMRRALGMDTVEGIGEDVFQRARDFSSSRARHMEQYPILKELGLGDKEISYEKIYDKVKKMPFEDFDKFMNLIKTGPMEPYSKDLLASLKDNFWRDLSYEVFEKKRSSTFGLTESNAMRTYLNKIGDKRLKAMLSEEEVASLGFMLRWSDMIRVDGPRRSSDNPSGSADKIVRFLNDLGNNQRIPGAKRFASTLDTVMNPDTVKMRSMEGEDALNIKKQAQQSLQAQQVRDKSPARGMVESYAQGLIPQAARGQAMPETEEGRSKRALIEALMGNKVAR